MATPEKFVIRSSRGRPHNSHFGRAFGATGPNKNALARSPQFASLMSYINNKYDLI